MCEFFFADSVDEIEIECTACGGEGSITILGAIDRTYGGYIEHGYTCTVCDGRGFEFVQPEPITLADLLELDAEMVESNQ